MDQIIERQNIVEVFFEEPELRRSLQDDQLKRIPDVNRLMRKMVKGNAGLPDVLRLYQFVQKLAGIQMVLGFYAGQYKELITAKYEEPLGVCSPSAYMNRSVTHSICFIFCRN